MSLEADSATSIGTLLSGNGVVYSPSLTMVDDQGLAWTVSILDAGPAWQFTPVPTCDDIAADFPDCATLEAAVPTCTALQSWGF